MTAGCGGDEGRNRNFDGPWQRHVIDDSLSGADGVRLADLNADGLPDIATGWERDGITRVYLHPGHHRVEDRWPSVLVGATPNVEDAVFADIDGDGHDDVVSSSEGKTRRISVSFAPSDPDDLLNPTAWTTEAIPATLGRRWMFAVPMDVDGRNGIDLVVGGKLEGAMVGWLESPPEPRDLAAWNLHEIAVAGWIMSLHVVDMNDDGVLDLLVSDRSSSENKGVHWYALPLDVDARAQSWTRHRVGARGRSPTFIAPVLEQNSVTGVLVPSGGERLTLYQRETPAAILWREYRIQIGHTLGTPKSVGVGDIDEDGVQDAVLAFTNLGGHDEGIVWLSHGAVPESAQPLRFSISGAQGEKFDRVELVDLDGDQDLDVLTTEEIQDLGVIWYENPLR